MHDRPLYPPIEPYADCYLDVGGGHRLYVESSGNPAGRPIVVLHGGPGAGAGPVYRQFFDPAVYRIIVFDQRGAGRSEPLGCVEHNTTAHLIADVERVRVSLRIERWAVFGGSWGSTLALAYAADHADRIAGLILRGAWLGRKEDVDWLLSGLRLLAPDHWQRFAAHIPEHEHADLLGAYWRRLDSPDHETSIAAAKVWCAYERSCSTLVPHGASIERSPAHQVALARIEAYYFSYDCFLDPGAILAVAKHLSDIPGIIVHGRYDLLAPLDGAFMLAGAWPAAELQVVNDAGHALLETGIRSRLLAATDYFATLSNWE